MNSMCLSASQYCAIVKSITPSLFGRLVVRNRHGLHHHYSERNGKKSILSRVDGKFPFWNTNSNYPANQWGCRPEKVSSLTRNRLDAKCRNGTLFLENGNPAGSQSQSTLSQNLQNQVKFIPSEKDKKDSKFLSGTDQGQRGDEIGGKEWTGDYLQASILDSILGIIKLLFTLVAEFVKTVFRMIRSLLGDKSKMKLDDATSKAQKKAEEYGPGMVKNLQKSQQIIQRELPKFKDKLEKDVPLMKKSMKDFNDRFDKEMMNAKTPLAKREAFFRMMGELIMSNIIFQAFIVFLALYMVYTILRFIFCSRRTKSIPHQTCPE